MKNKQDQLQTQLLFKKVQKKHLSEIFPGRGQNSYPRASDHAIVDEDDNILSFCSGSYNLRPNDTLYKPLEDLMSESKIPFERKISIVDGSKFFVDYIIKNRLKSLTVNDLIPKFSIWNSYDGKVKTVLKFGFHRVICSNGLTRPDGAQINISSKHRISAKRVDDIDLTEVAHSKILENVNTFLSDTKRDLEMFERLNQIPANSDNIATIGKKFNLSDKVIATASDRYKLEIGKSLTYVDENGKLVNHKGSPETLYTVYNALNFGIYNNNMKEMPEVKINKDHSILSAMISHPEVISKDFLLENVH